MDAKPRISRFLLLLLWLAIPAACRQRPDITMIAHPVNMDPYVGRKIEAEIQDARREKDELFKTSPDSPLPPQLRLAFRGLEYYPINWNFRFEGPVNPYQQPQKVQMIETDGKKRDALRYGYVLLAFDDRNVTLQVYKLLDLDQKNMLFIPFIDANGGKETYPAGRYIDLVEKANNVYVIDFNSAYNPYCAYGGDYVCPVTPPENRIPVPILAGEKILPLAKAVKHG